MSSSAIIKLSSGIVQVWVRDSDVYTDRPVSQAELDEILKILRETEFQPKEPAEQGNTRLWLEFYQCRMKGLCGERRDSRGHVEAFCIHP
jgi:hypothetical protein